MRVIAKRLAQSGRGEVGQFGAEGRGLWAAGGWQVEAMGGSHTEDRAVVGSVQRGLGLFVVAELTCGVGERGDELAQPVTVGDHRPAGLLHHVLRLADLCDPA